jgi:hypothetical protein
MKCQKPKPAAIAVSASQPRGTRTPVRTPGITWSRGTEDGWAWRTHPFNPANNINGPKVEGADALSGRVHTIRSPEVNTLQAAYIRKVVDTLNGLDNVLYKVLNDRGGKEWNWWVIDHSVHNSPYQYMAVACGVGLLLGLFVGRAR